MEGGRYSTLEAIVVMKVRNHIALNEMEKRGQIYDMNKVNIQKM